MGEDVWVEFLLSSCSLVRLFVNLQGKVTEKRMEIFKVFCGKIFEVKDLKDWEKEC